jgi:hypothetical protein
MDKVRLLMSAASFCVAASICAIASAHGFVGDRFFPPTIATDDPFAVDELSLPEVSFFTNSGQDGAPNSSKVDTGWEFDKEIFPHFAIGISDDYVSQKGDQGSTSAYGWDNLELSAKQELWHNDEHEAIVSVGLVTDIGGTGSPSTANRYTTWTPNFYFGKGFGDLPDSLDALKPLAITGVLGQAIPSDRDVPQSFQWGLALEYSLPYLEQQVKDIGIPAPFKNMIPLVEFPMSTQDTQTGAGYLTGTINPGVLWETDYCELGAEAMIPINRASGAHVGGVVQIWVFIDDIFPNVFGHAIFGGGSE